MTNGFNAISLGALDQIPIEIMVSVGRARSSIRDLINLQNNSLLQLDRQLSDPVELFVGDRLIARGELQTSNEETGSLIVKLTEVISP